MDHTLLWGPEHVLDQGYLWPCGIPLNLKRVAFPLAPKFMEANGKMLPSIGGIENRLVHVSLDAWVRDDVNPVWLVRISLALESERKVFECSHSTGLSVMDLRVERIDPYKSMLNCAGIRCSGLVWKMALYL